MYEPSITNPAPPSEPLTECTTLPPCVWLIKHKSKDGLWVEEIIKDDDEDVGDDDVLMLMMVMMMMVMMMMVMMMMVMMMKTMMMKMIMKRNLKLLFLNCLKEPPYILMGLGFFVQRKVVLM